MQKQIPKRLCVSCRNLFDKKDLIRIVRTPQDEVVADLTGKAAGRGAYLCKDPECMKKCVKSKLLNKVFKSPVSDEAYLAIAALYES